MQKPKLLIAGGGYAEIPLIEAAKELGFFVITSGNRPQELGHAYADLYEPADFSNKEEILAIAQKHNISAICAACNDFSALSSAYVAEKMQLLGHDSYENTKIIHHKDKFRRFCIENNLSVPHAKDFSSIQDAFTNKDFFEFPIIVKPVDLTGGKGISVVKTELEYEAAVIKAFEISRAKKIVIEDYIEGSNHGFSALIQNGKVVFHFADDEYYIPDEFWVSGTSTPASITENEIKQLIDFTEKTVSLLNLCDGLFHIQCIIRKGKVYIIEVCRRPPGDLYLKFVQHATGFNYAEAFIQFVSGIQLPKIKQIPLKGFFARHCISSLQKGYISHVTYSSLIINSIIEEFRLWKPDVYVENFISQKAAVLFMEFKTEQEMKFISNTLYQHISYNIKHTL
jgi:biotin carboxylase